MTLWSGLEFASLNSQSCACICLITIEYLSYNGFKVKTCFSGLLCSSAVRWFLSWEHTFTQWESSRHLAVCISPGSVVFLKESSKLHNFWINRRLHRGRSNVTNRPIVLLEIHLVSSFLLYNSPLTAMYVYAFCRVCRDDKHVEWLRIRLLDSKSIRHTV